jgi:hypothetical protein
VEDAAPHPLDPVVVEADAAADGLLRAREEPPLNREQESAAQRDAEVARRGRERYPMHPPTTELWLLLAAV